MPAGSKCGHVWGLLRWLRYMCHSPYDCQNGKVPHAQSHPRPAPCFECCSGRQPLGQQHCCCCCCIPLLVEAAGKHLTKNSVAPPRLHQGSDRSSLRCGSGEQALDQHHCCCCCSTPFIFHRAPTDPRFGVAAAGKRSTNNTAAAVFPLPAPGLPLTPALAW